MPEEVEDKASWLLQRLQAECCEAGAWVENKGIVLALHHEAWKEKTAIGENSIVTNCHIFCTQDGIALYFIPLSH